MQGGRARELKRQVVRRLMEGGRKEVSRQNSFSLLFKMVGFLVGGGNRKKLRKTFVTLHNILQ